MKTVTRKPTMPKVAKKMMIVSVSVTEGRRGDFHVISHASKAATSAYQKGAERIAHRNDVSPPRRSTTNLTMPKMIAPMMPASSGEMKKEATTEARPDWPVTVPAALVATVHDQFTPACDAMPTPTSAPMMACVLLVAQPKRLERKLKVDEDMTVHSMHSMKAPPFLAKGVVLMMPPRIVDELYVPSVRAPTCASERDGGRDEARAGG